MLTILVLLIVGFVLFRIFGAFFKIVFVIWLGVTAVDQVSLFFTGELPEYRQERISARE